MISTLTIKALPSICLNLFSKRNSFIMVFSKRQFFSDISELSGQCFRDNSNRVLNGTREENKFVTIESCIEFCSINGYAYAGVESEDQCFCGDNAPTQYPIPDSECNWKCKGNQTQTCGGHWAINVYAIPKTGLIYPKSFKLRLIINLSNLIIY